jgi:hypothetical protein
MDATQEPSRAAGSKLALRLFGVMVLCLVVVNPSFSQGKVPVLVLHSNQDAVGISYAYYLKEAIRRSASFELHTDGSLRPHIKVALATVDESARNPGNASSIAITIVYDSVNAPLYGLYLTTLVHSCGVSAAQSCAQQVLPRIDEQVVRLRESGARYWRGLYTGSDAVTATPVEQTPPQPRPAAQPKPTARPPENPF